MKKTIIGLLIAAALIPASYANAGGRHGNDWGRVIGYSAAAALTVGAVSALCCNNRSYGYNRGYDYDRYERARYEQAQYDAVMRDRYYNQPVYYAPPPRIIYTAPQPVYYSQPVYVQPQPVYYQPYRY